MALSIALALLAPKATGWTAFKWLPQPGVGKRSAIAVPITLAGREYWYQLDTGADGTIAYGGAAKRWGWTPKDRFVSVRSIRFGGMNLAPARIFVMPDMTSTDTAGTVGLDILLGNILVIDFPHCRFRLFSQGDAPTKVLDTVKRTNGIIRNGKFFLESQLGGAKNDTMFLDTGASMFPVMVDRAEWEQLTGRNGESDAAVVLHGTSWGKQVPFVGAPAKGALNLGSLSLGSPMIFYRGDQPEQFAGFKIRATGLIGCAPFWDKILVIDLGPHPGIRVLPPSDLSR